MQADTLVEPFQCLELDLLHEGQTRDSLEARLDADFVEVGPDGRVTSREQVMRWLLEVKRPEERWTLADFSVTRLCPTVVLARYHASRVGSASPGSLRASLWRQGADGEWRLVFHQATPLGAAARG